MLKIKDNVDLKELEKFGFEYMKDDTTTWYEYENKSLEIEIFKDKEILVFLKNYYMNHANVNILYDLIQADLVEEVED